MVDFNYQLPSTGGFLNHQLSNEKKPWLFAVYRGSKTTQVYGDYNKPL